MATAIMISDSIKVLDEEERYLAEIPEARLQAVFAAPDGLIPIVETIENLVRQFTPDMSTAKGRAAVRSLAAKVTRSKTFLDEIGKGLVADLKDLPKRIDANRRTMRDRLDTLATEARKPLTDYEERIERHQNRLKTIAELPVTKAMATAAELKATIDKLAGMPMSAEAWEEFYAEAKELQTRTLATLGEMHAAKWQAEQEAAELARLRTEAAERERQDSIRRVREEALAQATREAESKAKQEREAAAYREEQAKLQAEVDRKRAADAESRLAEAKRLSEERERQYQAEVASRAAEVLRQKEEAERAVVEIERRRKENFRQVNSEVAADIEGAIAHTFKVADSESLTTIARAVVKAIATGIIRHTAITY